MKPNRCAGETARYALASLGLFAAAVFAPPVFAQAAVPSYFGGESWTPRQAESALPTADARFPALAPPTTNESYFGGESWMPQQAEATGGGDAAASATDVAADRDLWIRSGMATVVQGEAGPDLNSPEYREHLTVYSALRGQRALATQPGDGRESQVAGRPAAPRSF